MKLRLPLLLAAAILALFSSRNIQAESVFPAWPAGWPSSAPSDLEIVSPGIGSRTDGNNTLWNYVFEPTGGRFIAENSGQEYTGDVYTYAHFDSPDACGVIYAGSNSSTLKGSTYFYADSGIYNSIYGGGRAYGSDAVVEGSTNVVFTGLSNIPTENVSSTSAVYGGGYAGPGVTSKVMGGTNIRISGAPNFSTYSSVFGGGYTDQKEGLAVVEGGSHLVLDGNTQGMVLVSGGGWAWQYGTASVTGGTHIELKEGGNVDGIYGGGRTSGTPNQGVSRVDSVRIDITGGEVARVMGGGEANWFGLSEVTGHVVVNVSGGTVSSNLAGGGEVNGDHVEPNGLKGRALVGGGVEMNISEDSGTTLLGDVYGGGMMFGQGISSIVEGGSVLTVSGGSMNSIHGGGALYATAVNLSSHVYNMQVSVDTVMINFKGGRVNGNVYGGGEWYKDGNYAEGSTFENMVGSTTVNITGGEIAGSVYAGGSGEGAVVTGNADLNISGGSIGGNIYTGGENGSRVLGTSTITITGGSFAETTVVDGSHSERSILNWGTEGGAYAGRVAGVTNFSDLNVGKGSSLVITSSDVEGSVGAFTTTLDGTLIVQGGKFYSNDVYAHEGCTFNLKDGATGEIASYLAFGGTSLVENSELSLGTGSSATADSLVGGLPDAHTTLTIGKDGTVNALKGLAIGQRSDASVTKDGSVIVNTGGTLNVSGNALRVGAGRNSASSDGTSGHGTLIINGGTVNTDMLFVGDVRGQSLAGTDKIYNSDNGLKGSVSISGGGVLNVTAGAEGNCTVLGADSALSVLGSGTLITSGAGLSYKWLIAQQGSSLVLDGAGTIWSHPYEAAVQEGAVFRLLNGASAHVDYLAYGAFDGLIAGSDTKVSVLTLGENMGGRVTLDSALGGTSSNGRTTTLTVGTNGRLVALQGISLGHRSDSSVSKDAVVNVQKGGFLEVSGQALRVGAGRSANGDGTSGNGILHVAGGAVKAGEVIVGDIDPKVLDGRKPGTGFIFLENSGSLELDRAVLGSSGTLTMDASSKLNVLGSLSLNGGTATIGGVNSITEILMDSGSLNLLVSGTSLNQGSVMKLGTIPAPLAGSGIVFSLVDKGLDYIGKTVYLVRAEGQYLDLGGVSIEGTAVSKGDSGELNRDGISFQWTYQGDAISIGNKVVSVLPPGADIKDEQHMDLATVTGTVTSGADNSLTFTPDPSSTEHGVDVSPVKVAENVTVSGGLTLATQQISKVTVKTETLADGTVKVTEERTPIGTGDVTLIVNTAAQVTSGDGQSKGSIGTVSGQQQTISNAVLTASGSLVLDNTDLTMGKKLSMSPNASLTVGNGSTVTIGGYSGEISPEIVTDNTTSTISGAALTLTGGGTLKTEAVTVVGENGTMTVLPKVHLNDTVIDMGGGDSDANVGHLSGRNADMVLVGSTVRGTGSVSSLTSRESSYVAGHSPGIMTLENISSYGDTFTVYVLGDRIREGALNGDATAGTGSISQFAVKGSVHLENASLKVSLSGAQGSSLTEDTAFRFVDLGEGSLSGNFASYDLPELSGDLFWDLTGLMKNGVISIVGAHMGEGRRIANTMWSAAHSVSNFAETALGHVHDFRRGTCNVWVSGLGDFSHAGNHNGRMGYDYQSGGYAVGFDRAVTDRTIVGLSFGQTYGQNTPNDGSLRYTAGKIDQDGIMGALYGREILSKPTEKDTIGLENHISYGAVSNKSVKSSLYDASVPAASGKWDDDVWSAGISGVWNRKVNDRTNVSCFLGMDYIHVSMDDFTETNGASWARYKKGSYQEWQLKLGATIDHTWNFVNGMALRPSLTLAYVGDVSRNTPIVNTLDRSGKTYRESAVNPGRNALRASVGLGWKITNAWSASTGYGLEARSGSTNQNVNLGVNYSF